MISHQYEYDGILIDCLLEYSPAVVGARERGMGGLPLEPDYPATTELLAARVGGIDILPLLRQQTIDDIEWEALQCY
ncbi:hypothetical protein UFOVP161_24 [uncultured Caudovirales phage]|uniref:Uncharacterized protein n=1 Tax=uncultured Caudovirales phage TaxID=2100421 RepID=A0A6J7W9R9_9CAUD|nr:hypothetical protein UFOVP161_24 [uncultured Caudovirales phage]